MSKAAYWVSQYIFDITKQMILGLVTIAFVYIYDLDINYMWFLILMYSLAIVPYTYVCSFIFKSENGGENCTMIHHFMIGGFGPLAFFILRIIKSTRDYGEIFMWPMKIFPMFCLCEGIVNIPLKDAYGAVQDPVDEDKHELDLDIAGGALIALAAHFIIDTLILIIIEFGLFEVFRRISFNVKDPERENEIDEDVVEEENRVMKSDESELAVSARRIRKVYRTGFGHVLAAKHVSFGLEFGDCFALLGINGAGKTTTFKMLTGEVMPTEGEMHICGFDVKKKFSMARKQIGYCPQFDAIFPLLSVREHLEFYCKIKKIPFDMHEKLIQQQLKDMNLTEYEKKPAGSLSGGNKRKLNVAMAMIGNPPVIFLDEPSAGMDPHARRFMWKVIARVSSQRKNSAVILTTHSMEEAEALSNKMGIMVAGEFQCFGSKQHIKEKFGTGYQVEVSLAARSNDEVNQSIQEKDLERILRKDFAVCLQDFDQGNGRTELRVNETVAKHILKEIYQLPELATELNIFGLGKECAKQLI